MLTNTRECREVLPQTAKTLELVSDRYLSDVVEVGSMSVLYESDYSSFWDMVRNYEGYQVTILKYLVSILIVILYYFNLCDDVCLMCSCNTLLEIKYPSIYLA